MHEILKALPPGSTVLDLGSGTGSFNSKRIDLRVVRADSEPPPRAQGNFVACTASKLPFAKQAFRAVILNHSLEHFENLEQSVTEIASVLEPLAFVYIAVPRASTFTDRIYRWLGRGGGHVNLFTDPAAIPRMITAATGLAHAGTRVLYTSLSFLNRRNMASPPPRKLLLFAYGHEGFLRL
jgi:ubiquinone/menaquinone biosynthesis C-methylase UbiE